jgi:hypothetical protein
MKYATLALNPTSGDMSQATVTIGPLNVQAGAAACIQIAWSGSPTGTLQLQGTTGAPTSGGSSQAATWPGPWSNVGTAVSLPLSTGGTSYVWDIVSTGLSAFQVVYTRTSGTGTITTAQGQQKV